MRKFSWHHVHRKLLSETTLFSPNHFELTSVLYMIEAVYPDQPSSPPPYSPPENNDSTDDPNPSVLDQID